MNEKEEKVAKEYKEFIKDLIKNEDNEIEYLKKLYAYTKEISKVFYNGLRYTYTYANIMIPLMDAENRVNSDIIDTTTGYVYTEKGKEKKDFDNILDYISYEARRHICYVTYGYNFDKNFDDIILNNKSIHLNKNRVISNICSNNNLDAEPLIIVPGYDKDAHLFDKKKEEYHYPYIIRYNGDHYLLDVTFAQFFKTRYNLLDRLGLMRQPTCDPGVYILMSETGKEITNDLIKKGYTKLDGNKLKVYLDSFTMSSRNGLYYERTKDFSFTTNYSLSDYRLFLNGYKTQANIEGIENLGYQIRPLKNPKMLIMKK